MLKCQMSRNDIVNFKLSHSLSNSVHLSLNNSQQKQYSLIRPTISLTLAVVLTISPRNMFSIPQLRCDGGPIFRSQERNREVSRYIPL